MYVNNETGCVQPIREIGKMIERVNSLRIKNNELRIKGNGKDPSAAPQPFQDLRDDKNSKPLSTINHQLPTENRFSKIYFHCDAVQAAEFFEMGTKYLHVDLLTLTAHKIHGPKGTGVLFVKKGTPIEPQIIGGEHEFRMRAGTENVSGIVGLMAALELIVRRRADEGNRGPIKTDPSYPIFKDKTAERVKKLRDKLEETILKTIPETYLNGDKEKRSPSVTNISFKNAEGEAIILNLDFLGIAVSSGSACTARSLDPSHVLMAMDTPRELSHGAIRFSLSRETTEEEIDKVLEVMPGIIMKLREMSPFN
jgi:cysteine desulfurase